MEESRKEKLIAAGVELESAMERFMGNEELLIRFLKKFSQDPNFDALKTAMEEQRYEDAFKAAHILKGLCGNLSLNALLEGVSEETELLRHGNYAEAADKLPALMEKYEETVEALNLI
ncbi:MAG: Hpt domain-containing protein [Lachnospiraceae bacterium]|nr:Hpt domain-containing protein [Lachnospiraceae bacterium]